jgi:hypothetical protein
MHWIFYVFYCLIAFVPFFIIKNEKHLYFKAFGVLILVSLGVSYIVSAVCAASVWCFFSALCSLFIVVILQKINQPHRR